MRIDVRGGIKRGRGVGRRDDRGIELPTGGGVVLGIVGPGNLCLPLKRGLFNRGCTARRVLEFASCNRWITSR